MFTQTTRYWPASLWRRMVRPSRTWPTSPWAFAPGDGVFTTWSYRAGPGRAEAFLLNPQPLTARIAHEWGVVAEVVPNGKALSRARSWANYT